MLLADLNKLNFAEEMIDDFLKVRMFPLFDGIIVLPTSIYQPEFALERCVFFNGIHPFFFFGTKVDDRMIDGAFQWDV